MYKETLRGAWAAAGGAADDEEGLLLEGSVAAGIGGMLGLRLPTGLESSSESESPGSASWPIWCGLSHLLVRVRPNPSVRLPCGRDRENMLPVNRYLYFAGQVGYNSNQTPPNTDGWAFDSDNWCLACGSAMTEAATHCAQRNSGELLWPKREHFGNRYCANQLGRLKKQNSHQLLL